MSSRIDGTMSLLALALSASPALAAASYTNDFSGTGGNTAFASEVADGDWTVTDGVYRFATSSTTLASSTASTEIGGVAGSSFTIETQFTVNSAGNVNNDYQTLGFGLLGANATFNGTSLGSAYYLADFAYAAGSGASEGRLRIRALGDDSGYAYVQANADDNAGSSSLAVVAGTTYTLRLQGVYTGSTLDMTLGLFDAVGTTQIGTSATASDITPLTGTHFGYRNRYLIAGQTLGIDFDNFSVVPEPASVALLGIGGALMVGRRRAV